MEKVREHGGSRKLTLTFLCPLPRKHSSVRCPSSPYQERRNILILEDGRMPQRIKTDKLCEVSPSFLLFFPHTSSPIKFPHNCPLFIKPTIKHSGLIFLFSFFRQEGLNFLRRLLCHLKLVLNKSVRFSPVHLSFSVYFPDKQGQ